MFVILSANLRAFVRAHALHKIRKHTMIKMKWNETKRNGMKCITYVYVVSIYVYKIKCVFVSCHTVAICLACILESFPIMLSECAGSFSNSKGDYHRLTHTNTYAHTHSFCLNQTRNWDIWNRMNRKCGL